MRRLFAAQSEADLHRLATMDGASAVEDMDEPGGGRRVRLTDPHGYQVEVVWGRAAVPEIDMAAGKVVVDPPAGLLDPVDADEGD